MRVSDVKIMASEVSTIQKWPLAAALISLIGLADAIYLTVHHYAGQAVQCMDGFACELVLTSKFAEIAGIPLAAFGAAAYFTVFSLAILAAFGNARAWQIASIIVGSMAIFTAWLVYLQAFVIHAFCQFCLLSAGVTTTLLVIVILSRYFFKRLR